MNPLLGALLVWMAAPAAGPATLGVHLEEIVDLPLRDAGAVAEGLAASVELRAGVRVRVDDPLSPRCDRRSRRCIGEVAARMGTNHLVFLRVIGGVTKVRVIAERLDRAGRPEAEATINLPRDLGRWKRRLDRLAGMLFPEPLDRPQREERLTTESVDDDTGSDVERAAPWVVLGVGVAAGAAGLALGVSSASARDRIENENLSGPAYTDALDQMQDHGTAANVLFGVAAGGVLTGVLWLLLR